MEHKGKMIKTGGCKLLLDALKLIGISRSDTNKTNSVV
jgi:hypothetical protein